VTRSVLRQGPVAVDTGNLQGGDGELENGEVAALGRGLPDRGLQLIQPVAAQQSVEQRALREGVRVVGAGW
jgi:hypothetical protein